MAEHSGAHQDSRPGTRRGSDSARRITEYAPRAANSDGKPVLFRITATDWGEGGITIEESALFAKELAAAGIDLLDVSSGLGVRDEESRPPVREAVHVDLANTLREASGLPNAPVGQIGELSSDLRTRGGRAGGRAGGCGDAGPGTAARRPLPRPARARIGPGRLACPIPPRL
ncbi:hypothetical protein KBZ94_12110 [Streptomyces sp. RM72]|uniref:hypothetical protein n=1 Tax=Streptomyces sp. RM72 TaxID=1115510 RepID=UPI001B3939C3|nr:hypothetical protein [Streptomyces sp. RM72]MBQ0885662.1 hypothetical protein [Streptomyces sp. RM72]